MKRTLIDTFAACLAAIVLLVPAARAADFAYPLKPATSADGATIYVASLKLPGVLAIKGGNVEVYFQADKQFRKPLNRIRSVAIDADGKLLAGDSATREIYRFNEPGKPTPLLKGAQAGIGIPMAIAVDSKKNLLVADLESHWIWKVPSAGGAAEKFAEVQAPRGMAIDKEDRLWIVSGAPQSLVRLAADGKKADVIASGAPFQFLNDVALDDKGNAYVSDGYAKTIWKIGGDGKPQPFIAKGLVNPVGLAWSKDRLIIADPDPANGKGQVLQADAAGKLSPLVNP